MRLTGTQQPLYFSDFRLEAERAKRFEIRLFEKTARSKSSAPLSISHCLGNRTEVFTFDQ